MKNFLYIVWLMAMGIAGTQPLNAQTPVVETQEVRTICSGDSLEIDYQSEHIVISKTTKRGFLYKTVDPVTGEDVDSIHWLIVNVMPKYLYKEIYELSKGSTYLWHGQSITEAGTYRDEMKSAFGCDSIYELTVTEQYLPCQPRYGEVQHMQLCPNEQRTWQGKTIAAAGIYTDVIRSADGCDSILSLVVNITPADTITIEKAIGQNELPYQWEGQECLSGGTYTQSYTNQRGCDSTRVLHLHVYPTFFTQEQKQICRSELPYSWHGQILVQSGQYFDIQRTVAGYDSICSLQLEVLEAKINPTPLYIRLCGNDTYTYVGKEYGEGTHSVVLPGVASNSCDSIVTLQIQRITPQTISTSATFQSDQYIWHTWRDQTLTQTGSYRDTLYTKDGSCDSVYYYLSLLKQEAYHATDTTVFCQNELPQYRWNQTIREAGVYTEYLLCQNGLDSIVDHTVFVLPTRDTIIRVILCEGDVEYRDGLELKEEGTQTIVKQASNGCDSTITYIVSIKKPYLKEEYRVMDKNSSFEWHGQLIDHEGVYTAQPNPGNCDTTYRIEVKVYSSFYQKEEVSICQSELPYPWKNRMIGVGGTHFIAEKNQYGLDSIHELVLTVYEPVFTTESHSLCEKSTITIHGIEYSEPGRVVDTLRSSLGCDSIVTHIINRTETIHRKDQYTLHDGEEQYYWPISKQTYHHAGLYTYAHPTENGCDVTDTLLLHVERSISLITCADAAAELNGKLYHEVGIYDDTVHLSSGADSILHITVSQHPVLDQHYYIDLPQGESYTWGVDGETYTEAGEYIVKKTGDNGCENHYTLHLNIWQKHLLQEEATICEGETYEWQGEVYSQTGTYRKNYKTVHNMDSIYELTLTVLPVDRTTESISFCEGDTLILGNLEITKGGLYTDTLTNTHGCDSIVSYQVAMKTGRHYIQNIQLLQGETIIWNGETINQAGIYRYTEQAQEDGDCPTIHELVVTVALNYTESESVRICENELPYRWRGLELTQSGTWRVPGPGIGAENYYEIQLEVLKRTYEDIERITCANDSVQIDGKNYAPGVYTDTLLNAQGCDSIRRIVIRAIKSDTINTYANISDQQQYTWSVDPTVAYTHSGTYYKEFKNQAGCDSIHILHLNVWPTYYLDTTVTVCQNELPYHYHGRSFGRAGIYEDRYQTVHGYDSIYTLTLKVNPVVEKIQTIHLCQGSTYLFNGVTIDHAGEYRDTLTSLEYGCDSIIVLRVEEAQRYYIEENQSICDQESYFWPVNQQTYTTGGEYHAYFQSKVSGCDSTHVLRLTVYPTYHMDTVAEICQTELPFEWHGKYFTNSGTYYDRYTTIHGYDSIYELHLTVHQVEIEEVTLKLCKGDTIYYNGKMYTAGGIYQDADECTRAYRIIVSEYVPREYRTVAWLHGSQTYYWKYGKNNEQQKTFNKPGVYKERVLDTESNCYDTYILDLKQGDSFFSEEEYTICEGEPFVWRGKDLSHANVGTTTVYYDSLQTALGNDSVYKLTLTVGKKYLINQALIVCQGGTITWNGQTYKAGVYTDTLHTILGCDSIVRTVVTEANSYYIEENATLTAGESMMWNGQRISKDGDFYHYGRTAAGCDSTIVLHVTVIPAAPENWLITEEGTICEGEQYRWRGRWFMTTGTYYDSLKCTTPAQLGKDSVYMLKLTVYPKYEQTLHLYTCNEGTIRYNGVTYTQADEGTSHEVKLATIHGCDSIIHLYVHFNQMFENYDTLHLNNQEQFTWQGQIITASGDYTARYEGQHGCDSVYHLHAIMENKYVFERDTAMCETEAPFEWRGITIPRRVGTYSYEDKYKEVINGEETEVIQRLNVTMWPVYEAYKQLNVCDGSQISYYGQVFDQPGDFDIVVKTQGNCDSIIHVHVNQIPSYHNVTEAFINTYKKGTYTWLGKTYNEAGTYTIQTQNEFGCEQIDQLILKELPVKQDTQVICHNELPYIWRGHSYNHSCDVEEFERDENNVDTAMYTLHLEVRPQYESYQQINVCEGSNVTFLGKNYDGTVGKDTIFLKSVDNCDSIVIVTINMYPSYHTYENKYLRPGDVIRWHGQEITEPGRYIDSTQTDHGCDNVAELFVQPLIVDSSFATICQGETYEWLGTTYTSTGLYIKPEKDIHGADSAEHRLLLTVNPIYELYLRKDFCLGETAYINGQPVTESADDIVEYAHTAYGCDSIIHWNITFHSPFHSSETRYLHEGDQFEWHGITITSPGYYTDQHESVWGCDSTYELTVLALKVILTEETICEADTPYIWHDRKYYESSEDYIQVQDIHQMDSAEYRLILTVLPQERDTIQEVLCFGEQYPYAGEMWSGNVDTILYVPQANGCNKIVHLMLREVQPYSYDSVVYLRDWQKLEWHDKTLPQNNIYKTYYDTVYSTKGCDSIYYSMDVRRMDSIAHDTMICKYDMPFKWEYDGNTYDKTCTIDYIEQDSLGRDSVIHTLNLKVLEVFDTTIVAKICDNQLPYRYTIPGHVFEHDATGTYHDTIPSEKYGVCDSIYNFILTVYPTHYEYKADTICETQLPYVVAGQKFWNEGQYYIETKTQECGCDSIIDLRLVIRPTMTKNDSIVMCKEDLPYYLGDTLGVKNHHADSQYHGLPFYTDTIVWDCDHTHFFHVIVRDPIPVDDIYFCEGDSVQFGFHNDGSRRWIYETGVYYDTISSHDKFDQAPDHIRCDSILRVNAYRLTRDTVYKTAHILSDSTYEFYGRELAMPGIYYAEDTVTMDWTGTDITKRRCNDMIELTLIVDTVYRFRDSIHVCLPVDSFYYHQWPGGHWQGDDGFFGPDGEKKKLKITHSGIYIDSLRRETTRLSSDSYYKNFKDSIYTLVVTMDTAYVTYQIYDLCKGDSVLFNEQWIYQEGIYRDTLTTMKGCDSIVQLVVNYIPSYQVSEKDVRISDKLLPYIWRTKDHLGAYEHSLHNSGLYADTLKTIRDCDSIVTLRLEVAPSYYIEDTTHVCSTYNGEEHTYRFADGHEFSFRYSGDYYDSLRTVKADPTWPIDSIYHLHVVTHFSPRTRKDTTICRDDSIMFNGKYIYHEGIYYDTLATMPRDQYDTCHCDSIIEWNIHFAEHYYVDEGLHYIAKGQNYLWHWQHNDTILRTEGIYYDRMQSIYGCDSVFRIEIRYAPTYQIEEREEVCQNELPYRWHGTDLYKTGTYYDSLQTQLGFDSVYVLYLHVHDSAHAYINLNTCEGDSLYYNGRWLTQPGEYVDTLKTSLHGCDSILHISFQLFPKYRKIEEKTISDKQTPYLWHSKELSNSGIYYDSLQTTHGCDSIYELHLTVGQTYFTEDNITICQSELPYTWKYQDQVLRTYDHSHLSGTIGEVRTLKDSIYYQTVLGFDSIYAINLTVLPTVYGDTLLGICEGDSVYVHGRYISVPGNYNDTLVSTQFGCDSIVRVKVTTINRIHTYRNIDLCQDDQFTLQNGERITANGTYTDTLKSYVTGCDSIIHYTIHFTEVHTNEYTYEINDKQTYEFFGEQLNQPKTYTHVDTARNGCDSLVTILHLVVWPSISFDSIATICQNETSIWQNYDINFAGREFTQQFDTVFTREYTTIHGADSIYRLHLKVMPVVYGDTLLGICEGDSVYVHGRYISVPGNYNDTLVSTQFGCDSIVRVKVTTINRIHTYRNIDLCQDDQFTLQNGERITANGTYTDTLKSYVTGCDSVIHYTIHFVERHLNEYTYEINDKQTYEFFGEQLNQPKTYTHVDTARNGCDSLVTILHLVVWPSISFDSIATICQNETSIWQNYDINFAGREFTQQFDTVFTREYTTIHGADSIYRLHLSVLPVYRSNYTISLCEGQTATYGGKNYSEAGVFVDTLRSERGCDSIVTITVQQLPAYVFEEHAHTSDKQPYLWHNSEYRFTGVYYDSLRSERGCDSIYVLHLTVYPTYDIDTMITICRSELPFKFFDTSYPEAGTYDYKLQTVMGYDSIYHIDLRVLETAEGHLYVQRCDGESLIYNGHTYPVPGYYQDTIRALNGCDSIVHIHFSQIKTQYYYNETSICSNETYYWEEGHRTLKFAGVYHDTIKAQNSTCDSVIYEMRLNVVPTFHGDTTIILCRDEGSLRFGTRDYYESGTYVDTMQSVTGCDSIWTIHLTIHDWKRIYIDTTLCENDVLMINGMTITRDGSYLDTIQSNDPASIGCGTIVNYTVHYHPTQHVHTQATIPSNEYYTWRYGNGNTRLVNLAGDYTDTVRYTTSICDSIVYHLHLKTIPVFERQKDTTVCSNDLPFIWNNHSYLRDTIFSDTVRTDSAHYYTHITLHVHQAFYQELNYDLCYGNVFGLNGQKYTNDTVFFDTIPTIYGCDSVTKYTIRVYPVMEHWDTVHIDQKNTYTWHGRVLNETGSYVAYEATDHECEDIYHLYLQTHPSYYFKDSVDLCDNERETLRWYGHGDLLLITEDTTTHTKDTIRYMETLTTGIYFDKCRTVEGYDSIYEHKVTVHPSYFKRETYNINFGQTLTLHGKKYTEPGVYLDTMYTIFGCDSVFHIVINNPRIMEYEEYESACENSLPFLYHINDTTYEWTKPGLYTVSFENATTGSLEIHKVHLTVYHSDFIKSDVLVADDKLPYFREGRLYYLQDSGTKYHYEGYNIHGCDSINEFTFNVTHRYNSLPDTTYFCRGEYVVVNGDTVREPTTIDIPTMRYNNVTDRYEVDSLHRVRYEYGNTYERELNIDLTQGESVQIGGHSYSKEGKDTIHLSTIYGCDSVIYLTIRLVPKLVNDERIIDICAGEGYLWHRGNIWPDTMLTVPGYYYSDTIIGLNSYHYSVSLSVKNPVNLQNISIPNVCADATHFEIDLNYGGSIDTYSVLFDAAGKRAGFKDLINVPYDGEPLLQIEMPVRADKTYFDGTNNHPGYVTPGDYTVRIQVNNEPCQNIEASATLQVLYPAWIMQQNWNDVVAVLDRDHNGGFEFKSFWWSLNGMMLTNTKPYLYYPGGFTVGDQVGLRVSEYSGGQGIAVCEPLIIQRYVNNDPDAHPYLTPSIVSKVAPRVQLKAEHDGTYRVITIGGIVMEEAPYEVGEQTITLPDVSGCYIIRTESKSGHIWTDKIIVL